jgi:DNA-binding response OmpR family regulator
VAQLAGESLDVLRPCSVIALVYDNAVHAGAVLDRFDEEGYQTLIWNWGAGLHAMARRTQPALIILDCDTKRNKGLGLVLRRLRRDSSTSHIPILFCTGLASLPAVPIHQREVIRKPYNLDALCAHVETVIGEPRRLHRRYRRRSGTPQVITCADG